MSNITTTYPVPSTPNTRIHKDHSLDHVIGDVQSGVQTRRMIKTTNEQVFISVVYEGKTHEDLHSLLYALFPILMKEPKKVIQALKDPSWIEAMKEELLQFKLQQMKSIMIRNNKAVAQGSLALSTSRDLKNPEFPDRGNKRIFRYLKVQPKLGLWYPRDSPFDLEAFSNSDYARASLDRKSTTRGCQFLRRRLISWQFKQTIVVNSTTEAEYVAAANLYRQVLWIQNQIPDYGFNFMNTKIYIDNESTIYIVKNLVFHSKTKHIEIRHHFIRDSYEKKLIQVIKIQTDNNLADLLIKDFDVSRITKRITKISQSSRHIHLVADETVHKELGDKMERATTTASSLEVKQDSDAKTRIDGALYKTELFWNTATSKTVNSVKQIHAIVDGKAVVITESSVRNDLLFDDEDGITCLTNDEIFENLALMGECNSFPTKTILFKKPNEPPLPEGHTSGSGKGRMAHTFELMYIVPPTPHDLPLLVVLDLEKEKDAQAVEILKLKKRVKKLERQRKSSISHPRRRIYRQVESSDDDLDEEDASKQGRTSDKTKPISGDTEAVNTAGEGVSTAAPRTPPTTTTVFDDEDVTMAMAQTLIKMKEEKAKEKGVAIKDVEDSSRPIRSITTLQPLPTIDPKDKGKGILQETEPVEKTKKKVQGDAQIERDAEVALRLQAELDEELRARIDADYELAARMTQEEQEKYTIEERARLLAEFFERRKKQLAAERAEAIRNKPPTKTQLRNLMMTYLKNMGGYKHSQLKGKSYEEFPKWLYERQSKEYSRFYTRDPEKVAQKADGSSSYHGDTQAFLRRLDRQDLNDLYMLVQERFQDHPLEGHDLLL
ncbi:hypothetical protein Tco_0066450 [Tanacetum coccineum]